MAKTRPAPGAPSGAQTVPSRLPSTRERRPALAALAILLIVGGALASGWLALRAGDRADFLRVKDEVAQGQRIGEDDLESVSLPEDFDGAIAATDKSSVVGQFATTRLLPQTILTPEMMNKSSGVDDHSVQFQVSTEAGDIASNLQAGANVAVYLTGQSSQARAIRGQVVEVSQTQGDSGIGGAQDQTTVRLSVDVSCGDAVASAKADDAVQIGLIGQVPEGAVASRCGG